jgi:hypothetical protein
LKVGKVAYGPLHTRSRRCVGSAASLQEVGKVADGLVHAGVRKLVQAFTGLFRQWLRRLNQVQ